MVERARKARNYETKTCSLNGIVNFCVALFVTPFVNSRVAPFVNSHVAPKMEVDEMEQDDMEEWSSRG